MALTEVTPTTDPYDISTQVQEFKEAYYGEDVRSGIINLANKLNNELNDFSTHEFIAVDATLSHTGQGADAKETGRRLNALGTRLTEVEEFKADTATVNTALSTKVSKTDISNDVPEDADSEIKVPSVKAIKDYVDGINSSFDDVPTRNSTNGVKSGGVFTAIENAEVDMATVMRAYLQSHTDSTPTADSDNFVTSGGVKRYVDDSAAAEIVGTFTPAQQLSGGSEIKLRQVGNIVYVQGMYGPDASTPHQSLGTGTGVAVPKGSREWLPCVTTDFQSYHAGYVALSKSGSTINFEFYGNTQDQILMINAFYIV